MSSWTESSVVGLFVSVLNDIFRADGSKMQPHASNESCPKIMSCLRPRTIKTGRRKVLEPIVKGREVSPITTRGEPFAAVNVTSMGDILGRDLSCKNLVKFKIVTSLPVSRRAVH